jgi:transposase
VTPGQLRSTPRTRRPPQFGRGARVGALLAHGLIRASFVPNVATQGQRGLLRTRKQLTRERTSHVQRLQRTLEEAKWARAVAP